jgi:hypothetical protein
VLNDDNEQVPFTENMVSDIIWKLCHISFKGIVWDRPHVKSCDQDDPHFQSLLSQIVSLNNCSGNSITNNPNSKGLQLCNENNTKLASLSIQHTLLSPNRFTSVVWGIKDREDNQLFFFDSYSSVQAGPPLRP